MSTDFAQKALRSLAVKIEISQFLSLEQLFYLPEWWPVIQNQYPTFNASLTIDVRKVNPAMVKHLKFCLGFWRY